MRYDDKAAQLTGIVETYLLDTFDREDRAKKIAEIICEEVLINLQSIQTDIDCQLCKDNSRWYGDTVNEYELTRRYLATGQITYPEI